MIPAQSPSRRTRAIGAALAAVALTVGVFTLWAIRGAGPPEAFQPVDPRAVYDPVDAGEPLPAGYRVGLPRDQIEPIYDPRFTDASAVDWPDEMLVIGVAGTETAKAYPLTHLNSHEMVDDILDGTPILVSW